MSEKGISANILVVDDEEGMCRLLKGILSERGHTVKTMTSPKRALTLLSRDHFDLVITDIKMHEMDGVTFLREILSIKPQQPVVMITAYGSIENAVESVRIGAYDYITKPFETDQILHSVEKILERTRLIEENRELRTELDMLQGKHGGVIGKSGIFSDLLVFADKIAKSDINVLITGESGTGKEVIAKYIHSQSIRAENPFITVQCGLIPNNLMESELFGYKKGAFTGAQNDKRGLFEEANDGTVLLDEIGDITPDVQAKLLRFMQDKEIRRVGETKSRIINVRLLTATNKDLQQLVKDKLFREDLYYRLKTVEINVPPLRKRKEDIPLLTEHFLARHNTLYKQSVKIDPDCYKMLISYPWPGNIRELRNMIETTAAICDQGKIKVSDVSYILHKDKKEYGPTLVFSDMKKHLIRDFESDYISHMLKKHKGNISAAARESGMDKKNFWDLMKKHSLSASFFNDK